MADELQAGAAYVQVMPSMRGWHRRVSAEVRSSGPVEQRVEPKVDQAALEKARQQVEAAAEKVAAARRKEADAAGSVRVAEAQLQGLRDRGTAKAAQLAASEERIAKAKRATEAATAALQRAERNERSATRRVARIEVETDTSRADAQVNTWFARIAGRRATVGISIDRRSFSDAIVRAATLGRALSTLAVPVAVVAGIPALIGLAGALAQTAGAALLLPAALGAGALAFGALSIATSGFGEAMKSIRDPEKFAEAIASLSPAARQTALAIQGLLPRFDELKAKVQDRFFAGLADQVNALAAIYLPILGDQMGRIADQANAAFIQVGNMLRESARVADVTVIAKAGENAFEALAWAVRPIVGAFIDIGVVGAPVLERITNGAQAAAERFGAFIARARESGQLAGWLEAGLAALRTLGELLFNVGSIVASVFGVMQAQGVGILNLLTDLTGAAAAFLRGPEGQAVLVTIFGTIAAVIDALKPALADIGAVILNLINAVAPSLPGIARTVSIVVGSFRPLADVLTNLIGFVLPPLVALLEFIAPALDGLVPVIGGLVGVVFAIIGAIKVWTAVQTALNIVMALNPLGLVILALTALAAALVFAWRRSETFRDIVMGAWEAIQTGVSFAWDNVLRPIFDFIIGYWQLLGAGAMWLWENAIQPAFDGIVAAARVVGDAAMWLWENAIRPAFDFIGNAALFLLRLLTAVVFGPILLAWDVLAAGVMWAWENVLKPAWDAVAAAGMWLWDNVLRPTFGFIAAGWDLLLAGIQLVWTTILQPTWNAVSTAAMWLWENGLRPVFDFIGSAWSVLSTGMRAVYDNVIAPLFGVFLTAVETFKGGFERVVGGIKAVWDGIRAAFAAPVNFIIYTVWNEWIGGLWNRAKSVFPLGDFPMATGQVGAIPGMPRFARGGPVREPTVGLIGEAGPEYVLSAPAVRALGGLDSAEQLHRELLGRRTLPGPDEHLPTGYVDTRYVNENSSPVLGRGRVAPDSGLWRDMVKALDGIVGDAVVTSAYRRGEGDSYHRVGKAIDIVDSLSWSKPRMRSINRAIADKYPNSAELIFTYPDAVNLRNGSPHVYNAATRADHRDHVHWAMRSRADLQRGGLLDALGIAVRNLPGVAMNLARKGIQKIVDELVPGIISRATGAFGQDTMVGRFPGMAAKWGTDVVSDFLFKRADEMDAGSHENYGGGGVERWRGVVNQALGIMGLPQSLAGTTLRRMNQESGGQQAVVNRWDVNWRRGTPSVGLMQVIGPTYRANRHPSYDTGPYSYGVSINPLANILASMRYALRRYGSLPRAYDRPGGYDDGGIAHGRGILFKDVIAPERVLSPRQTAAFEDLVPLLDRMAPPAPVFTPSQLAAMQDGSGGAAERHYHLTVYDAANNRIDLETQFRRLEMQEGI